MYSPAEAATLLLTLDANRRRMPNHPRESGCSSRWSIEIMAWKMKCKSGAQSGDLADADDIDAVNATSAVKITSFEYHMRLHQQRRATSGAKKENSNAISLKNPDYCAWCFKNTGKKRNNHSEATCNNKKRTEGDAHARPLRHRSYQPYDPHNHTTRTTIRPAQPYDPHNHTTSTTIRPAQPYDPHKHPKKNLGSY